MANEAGLESCFVVVAGGQDSVSFLRCAVLVNEGAGEGMASSIRIGVAAVAAAGASGVVVMACDQPAVTAAHLRLLIADGDEVTASGYAGRSGVPAYFPVGVFGELMELRGDVGARELLKAARVVELPGGELDVDTVEDLEQVRALFGS
jgi:CTP:molybdopterin cytidylyltransferase MocA